MINYFLLFIGGPEIFVIVLIIIMLFGAKRIPEIARGLGQGIREVKNATSDIQQEIVNSAKDIEKVKDSVNVEKQIKDRLKSKIEENKKAEQKEPEPEKEQIIIKSPETSISRSKTVDVAPSDIPSSSKSSQE